jgi:8-oxo-dGTP pyrophosphatase MutT (NUDIX family)
VSKPKKAHRHRRGSRAKAPPGSNAGTPARPKAPRKPANSTAPRARHFYDVRQYAILRDAGGHVLILQLPKEYDESAANTWTLPGGKLEPTDNPAEGLLREIMEETGLTPSLPSLCGIARWTTRASKKLGVFYRTSVPGTKPALKLSGEHQRAVWVAADDLAGFTFHRTEMLDVLKEELGK